jgi:hypothetical protein
VIPLDIERNELVKRHLIALAGVLGILLTAGSGAASAQSVQGVEQFAGTGQSASSNATSTQTNPTNSNVSVRIFSPGEGGDVTQENTSVAGAAAGNEAETTQAVSQAQSGAGEQAVGQGAATAQEADADATSEQIKPTNRNISVRIHSPGDDGDVEQSNSSKAVSKAGNEAETNQAVEQEQSGGRGKCCSGAGVQAVGQEAKTGQKADADAESVQYKPTNSNISVRIGSKGDNGSVKQSNTSVAKALAGNEAETTQSAVQDGSGGGCRCRSDRVQAVGQKALTGQKADADATSIQKGAKNSNVPVRIFSEGDDGDVEQSNTSLAFSGAFNEAETTQVAGQEQHGRDCRCDDGKHKDHGKGKHDHGHGGAAVQAVGQWAETWQEADSDATSKQEHPTNKHAPLRIKSKGDGGHVEQANTSLAAAFSLNRAFTLQDVEQEQ